MLISFIVLSAGDELKSSKNRQEAIKAWAINIALDLFIFAMIVAMIEA